MTLVQNLNVIHVDDGMCATQFANYEAHVVLCVLRVLRVKNAFHIYHTWSNRRPSCSGASRGSPVKCPCPPVELYSPRLFCMLTRARRILGQSHPNEP